MPLSVPHKFNQNFEATSIEMNIGLFLWGAKTLHLSKVLRGLAHEISMFEVRISLWEKQLFDLQYNSDVITTSFAFDMMGILKTGTSEQDESNSIFEHLKFLICLSFGELHTSFFDILSIFKG
ncbi:hypothetical protein ACJX0J_025855 [Zea mays]